MEDGPEQDALFFIEGPDEDGCVWISSTDNPSWHHNLGPANNVAEVLSQWLGTIDYGENLWMANTDKHGAPWSSSDIRELLSLKRWQMGRKAIAAQLGRTEAAIEAKLSNIFRGSSSGSGSANSVV